MIVVFETLFLIKSLFALNIMMQPFLCLMYSYIEINPISFLDDEYCSLVSQFHLFTHFNFCCLGCPLGHRIGCFLSYCPLLGCQGVAECPLLGSCLDCLQLPFSSKFVLEAERLIYIDTIY